MRRIYAMQQDAWQLAHSRSGQLSTSVCVLDAWASAQLWRIYAARLCNVKQHAIQMNGNPCTCTLHARMLPYSVWVSWTPEKVCILVYLCNATQHAIMIHALMHFRPGCSHASVHVLANMHLSSLLSY